MYNVLHKIIMYNTFTSIHVASCIASYHSNVILIMINRMKIHEKVHVDVYLLFHVFSSFKHHI